MQTSTDASHLRCRSVGFSDSDGGGVVFAPPPPPMMAVTAAASRASASRSAASRFSWRFSWRFSALVFGGEGFFALDVASAGGVSSFGDGASPPSSPAPPFSPRTRYVPFGSTAAPIASTSARTNVSRSRARNARSDCPLPSQLSRISHACSRRGYAGREGVEAGPGDHGAHAARSRVPDGAPGATNSHVLSASSAAISAARHISREATSKSPRPTNVHSTTSASPARTARALASMSACLSMKFVPTTSARAAAAATGAALFAKRVLPNPSLRTASAQTHVGCVGGVSRYR